MPEYLAPRGTNDVLPSETPKWEYIEAKFRETCALYDFKELRTPTFEHTDLFARNLGDTTDVVSKEMYTFLDRGERSITLRPEGTAPAIRAYVQHNLGANLPVNKIYYIGRIFRYERPQSGRYREHTQLGAEAIGSVDPAIDAEVISMAAQFYNNLGITNLKLLLNCIPLNYYLFTCFSKKIFPVFLCFYGLCKHIRIDIHPSLLNHIFVNAIVWHLALHSHKIDHRLSEFITLRYQQCLMTFQLSFHFIKVKSLSFIYI